MWRKEPHHGCHRGFSQQSKEFASTKIMSTLDWQTLVCSFGGSSPQEVIIYDNLLLKWAQGVIHPEFKRWIGRWWWSFWYILIIATLWPPIRCERRELYRKSQNDRKTIKRLDLWYLMIFVFLNWILLCCFFVRYWIYSDVFLNIERYWKCPSPEISAFVAAQISKKFTHSQAWKWDMSAGSAWERKVSG
jgi:hypothetical protein